MVNERSREGGESASQQPQIHSKIVVHENRGTIQGVVYNTYFNGELVEKRWVPMENLARAEHFQGREQELAALKVTLTPGEMATILAAGGMGKSALAAQVVWDLTGGMEASPELIPDGVVVFGFYGGGSVGEALTHIGRAFGFEAAETEGTPLQIARRALQGKTALLVLDGVEALREKDVHPGRLEDILSIRGRCGVLITSRDRRDGRGRLVVLESLDLEASLAVLAAHAGDFARQKAESEQICELVGRLPLALRLAGSTMNANQTYADEFLRFLKSSPLDGLHQEERQHESVLVLMEESLKSVSLKARPVLGAAGLLGLAPFPAELIAISLVMDEALDERAWKARIEDLSNEVRTSLSEIGRYGLVNRVGEEWQLSHALIRTYTNAIGLAPEGALENLAKLFMGMSYDANEQRTPAAFEGLRGHVEALAGLAEAAGLRIAGILWNNLGAYLSLIGDYHGARDLYQRALEIDEANYGPDHPQVATAASNLAGMLSELGDLAGARQLYERALAIDQAQHGPVHPDVAMRMSNLGSLLSEAGDLPGARRLLEQALTMDDTALGPEHPNVAIRANNLAAVLQALGDLEGARSLYERALRIVKKVYGPEHPEVALAMNNLGSSLQRLGDFERARQLYTRALEIDEAVFKADHPNVARDAANLGNLLQNLGEFRQAQEMYARALGINQAAYGLEHPSVAKDYNNLASLRYDLNDLEGARELLERALKIDEAVYGAEHLSLARRASNLGLVLEAQGDLQGARVLLERALRIREQLLPAGHADIERSREQVARIRQLDR